MADKSEALAKVQELAGKIGPLVQAYTKLSGKKEFTLANIVPGWDKIDDKLRELIGVEFKDHVAKSGIADIVQKGVDSSGVDLYELVKK